MAARAGGAAARDPRRGDHLEGAARLEPRRPAGGLQLVPRPPVAPALAHDGRRRRIRSSSPTATATRPRRAGRRTAAASPTSRTRAATRRSGSSTCPAGAQARGPRRAPGLPPCRSADSAAADGRRSPGPHGSRSPGRTAGASRRTTPGATRTTGSTAASAGSSTATSTPRERPRSPCPPAGTTVEVTRGPEYRVERRAVEIARRCRHHASGSTLRPLERPGGRAAGAAPTSTCT